MALAAASALAVDGYYNVATVSMTNATTPKLTSRYVCYTDGEHVACNSPSLYVSTGGLVGIGTSGPSDTLHLKSTGSTVITLEKSGSSNWSGIKWHDGATLTWVMFTDNSTPNAGDVGDLKIEAPVAGEGDAAPRIHLPVSNKNIYLARSGGNVGIGTASPTARLDVLGTISASDAIQVGGSSLACTAGIPGAIRYSGGNLEVCNGSSWGALLSTGAGGYADRIVSGTTSMVAVSNSGFISLTQAGVNTGWFDPQRGFVTIGVSSTGPISGTNGYFNGNVGIGWVTPSVALEVSGTISATSILVNGQPVGGSSGDRITSGTTSVIAENNGSVTVMTGGVPRMVVGGNGETLVSGTLQLVGAAGDEGCDTSHLGRIRMNPTTGTLQICRQ
jgi:hypothetical protein